MHHSLASRPQNRRRCHRDRHQHYWQGRPKPDLPCRSQGYGLHIQNHGEQLITAFEPAKAVHTARPQHTPTPHSLDMLAHERSTVHAHTSMRAATSMECTTPCLWFLCMHAAAYANNLVASTGGPGTGSIPGPALLPPCSSSPQESLVDKTAVYVGGVATVAVRGMCVGRASRGSLQANWLQRLDRGSAGDPSPSDHSCRRSQQAADADCSGLSRWSSSMVGAACAGSLKLCLKLLVPLTAHTPCSP